MRPDAKTIAKWTILSLCLLLPTGALADSTKSKTKTLDAGSIKEKIDPSDEILKASRAFFAGLPFMQAEAYYKKVILGKDQSYFLVSVQSADEFARGHVPGAVNIPYNEIASGKAGKILPKDKKIVVTCADGHRSMVAALYFGQLGYDTTVLSFGMTHWNASQSGITDPYPGSAGYPVSTAQVDAAGGNVLPAIATVGSTGKNVVPARAEAVLSSKRDLLIDRAEVYQKAVVGGDHSYFLVSLQRPEDYAKGHVPGAINIPAKEIAKVENLRKLPRDKKIVLICYIGHWGAASAFLLNQLGYEAYDMRFGTMGWNDQTEGLGELREVMLGLARSLNYQVEKGKHESRAMVEK
ncbi:rhodanese-like domain-containing protein [Geomesophilobacter sediminis]|uniref:Rhodanese-like domain-containing protein n=1 Tax=Geomesophilobacter sediminis TaxID=2798584 RepID=A0A8J7IZ27_9BACT|nr:rhodanese-like domain-containing protein [Geomesophilobacter sediminis]MBJ6723238.1 rhodanese-like domain-containing protein [Geomesophilobacter sediminis]